MRDYKLYLKDIINTIKRIENSLREISKEAFQENIDIQDAILRRLEIIGEAAANIPSEVTKKYPEVEWKKIIGFRVVVAHAYFKVDLDIVWNVISDKLPNLKKQIQEILEKESKNGVRN